MAKKNDKKILLVGAGGHCKVIIDALIKNQQFAIAGVIDKNSNIQEIMGVPYLGDDDILAKMFKSGIKYAVVAIGSIGNPEIRINMTRHLEALGYQLPTIIHPSAIIAESAVISSGSFIAAGVVIGPSVKIGKSVIVNTGACIDHDCVISDFVHIAPGVTLSGGVFVGEKAHLGTGSSVIGYRRIGHDTIIGVGSVVISDIPAQVKAYGHPCKVVNRWDQPQNNFRAAQPALPTKVTSPVSAKPIVLANVPLSKPAIKLAKNIVKNHSQSVKTKKKSRKR